MVFGFLHTHLKSQFQDKFIFISVLLKYPNSCCEFNTIRHSERRGPIPDNNLKHSLRELPRTDARLRCQTDEKGDRIKVTTRIQTTKKTVSEPAPALQPCNTILISPCSSTFFAVFRFA